MKLSTRGRYAVMAMADIAGLMQVEPVSLGDIADRQQISLAYLEQIFARLRKGGLVTSTRGPGGGYCLALSAEDIRISDIILAVNEPISVTRCRLESHKGCVHSGRCLTHDLWEEMGRHLHLFLASVSLADVVSNKVLGLAGRVPYDRQREDDFSPRLSNAARN